MFLLLFLLRLPLLALRSARAMTPAGPASDTQLTLVFIANNSSHKFPELEQDPHVNVRFYDE